MPSIVDMWFRIYLFLLELPHQCSMFYFLLFIFPLALATDCYQCSGTDNKDPFQCNEYLSDDIDIAPKPCDAVYGARYCVKHIGRFEGTPKFSIKLIGTGLVWELTTPVKLLSY